MLNQTHYWRQSQKLAVGLAVALSLFFALLFWIWERDLLWMLSIVLLPIWSSVIYRRFSDDPKPATPRRALGLVLVGLVALLGTGLVFYWIA